MFFSFSYFFFCFILQSGVESESNASQRGKCEGNCEKNADNLKASFTVRRIEEKRQKLYSTTATTKHNIYASEQTISDQT